MKRKMSAIAGALALVTIMIVTPLSPAAAAGQTLVINAGATLRPVTHVASGALYGLASPTKPTGDLLKPLRLNQLVQPPPNNLQAGGTGGALLNAPTAIGAGAKIVIRMPDIYPDFPYKWVSWDDWLEKVNTMVDARLAANTTTNINGWEIWNEPDGTWDTAKAGPFTEGWTRTYRAIRAKDTITPIYGPGTTIWNRAYMESFLINARDTNTLPDVVVWHELSQGWDNIDEHVADYRQLEASLGISPRKISINEYAWLDQIEVPSTTLHYIAQFERTVNDAARPLWYETGTLDGLLLSNGAPTSSYWMYKWYGDMAGNMLPVTASGPLDGIAALDSSRKIVNAVVGGESGTNSVRIDNLSGFGSTAKVTVSSTPNSGRTVGVSAPTVLSTTNLPISGNSVTVSIPNMDAGAAYQVLVTPQAGPTTGYQQVYEAENASIHNATTYWGANASNRFYVGQLNNSGDARNDSFIDFLVNVPNSGSYTMSVRYANGGSTASTQGVAHNGGSFSNISYAPTGGWGVFGSSSKVLNLVSGWNVIRIAKGSPGYGGGSGYAELDSITLTQ